MSSIDSFGVLNDGVTPNMRLGYNSDGAAVYKPMMPPNSPHSAPAPPAPAYQSGGGGGEGSSTAPGQQNKRKRGRPRKYPLEGGTVAPASTSRALPPPPQVEPGFQTSGFSFPAAAAAVAASGKKPRGRPPGSGRKQQVVAAGSPQVGLMPHVIQVKAGEDVSSKIMSLSQNGTGGICILSANGAISNVTLRQAATSGGTVTYEGRFEILSLSGSYTVTESDGQRSRTGGLSVLLSGPDGRVLGGGVAGLLTAAAPVQVVVGCFISGVGDLNSPNQAAGPSTAPASRTAPAPGSPASHGTMSESSGGPESPLNQSTGAYNHSNQQGMNALSWQ